MGWYLDGKVSALLGRIRMCRPPMKESAPRTAYLTELGMTEVRWRKWDGKSDVIARFIS